LCIVNNTIQYIIRYIQYSTIQYSTVQYSTVKYSTVQYSTVQYRTLQWSEVKWRIRKVAVQFCDVFLDRIIKTGVIKRKLQMTIYFTIKINSIKYQLYCVCSLVSSSINSLSQYFWISYQINLTNSLFNIL